MTIKEFNLLDIDVYDGENLIYSGMCEDTPGDIKEKQIKINRMDNKKLIVELVNS